MYKSFPVLEARSRWFIPVWSTAWDQLSIFERPEKALLKLYKTEHLPRGLEVNAYSAAANGHFTAEEKCLAIQHHQPSIEGLSKFQYKCLKKWNGKLRRLKRGWSKESELSLCNSWGQTGVSERLSVIRIACLPGMRHGLTKQISLWLVYQ